MSVEFNSIKHQKGIRVNSILFVLMIIVFGILFFVIPGDKISINEKRKLSSFPHYSSAKLFNGSYMDSIDYFYSDNFVFRNNLISFAKKIKECKGYRNKKIQYYVKTESADKKLVNNNKSDSANLVADEPNNQPYETVKSVVVSNKRAIQCFSGSNFAADNYVKMVMSYKAAFGDKLNIHLMAIPIGADFYLPDEINKKKEKEFIDHLYATVNNRVSCVRAYEELKLHKKEYIQFNTDHHWTGKGAYYAYQAYCKSIAVSYLPIQSFTRKVINNFLGTLYYYTLNQELKENKDSVEYFKVPVATESYYFPSGIKNGIPASLYAEYAKGGNSYGVFLGSDYPLMRVITSVKNGKKIAVYKDSYGNAFSPYLASHYEEIFIIDYRYFTGNIRDLVNEYGITDLLFAHNVYVLNSDYAVSREYGFLNNKTNPLPIKK